MIARSAHVGAVCLRCRLRLLQQFTPIRYIASDAPSAPSTPSTPSDRRPDDRTDGEDAIKDAGAAGQRSKSKPGPYPGRKRLNLHKQYLSGGRVLTEAAASLGSNMLGKPAYAIVMKDLGKIKKKKFRSATSKEEAKSSGNEAASIEALLNSQRAPPTQIEVRSNIQSLQPKGDRVLLEKDFRKLQRVLTRGFLTRQLQKYIEWKTSNGEPGFQEPTIDISDLKWIRELTPWQPLPTQSTAVDGSDPILQGYISDKTPTKEKLVIRLMRECWGLSIAELLHTQLGETWLKIQMNSFMLLMRGTQRFMNTLGEIWLEPGEQIEAIRNQRMLRLVTTKQKAETLIRDLGKTLKRVTTGTFPILIATSKPPDDATLEELGRITNTDVRISQTGRRLHVTWIELESRAGKGFADLEDLAHIVFRLLFTASGSPQTTSTLLSPPSSKARPGRLIVDVTSKDKLAWKDRLARWARYTQPLTPEESAIDAALPIKQFKLPFEPSSIIGNLNENLEFFPATKFPSFPVKWSNLSRTSTVAHFGQVLHPYQPSNPTPPLSSLQASTERRIFVPTTPHPLYLTNFDTSNLNTISPLVTTKQTIVLHFWPSPSSNPVKTLLSSNPEERDLGGAGDAPPAPLLELRLTTSDRVVTGIESLRAISRTHHTDVMLPSSPVDVRFTQSQYETLMANDPKTLAAWQPLADFFKTARLDLENGKLEVPPRQRFQVPKRLFAPTPPSSLVRIRGSGFMSANVPTPPTGDASSSTEQDQQQQAQSEDREDLVSVLYEFVGLELHLSATVPHEGHQLTYTSIEAGQGGGRRAEVILEPLEPRHSTTSSTEVADKGKLQEDFLACCSKFAANRSLWAGVGNYKRTA